MPLDIEQLREKAIALQVEIDRLLLRFTAETGLVVDNIKLTYAPSTRYHYGEYTQPEYQVKIDVDFGLYFSPDHKWRQEATKQVTPLPPTQKEQK